jgi:hypothetical protein
MTRTRGTTVLLVEAIYTDPPEAVFFVMRMGSVKREGGAAFGRSAQYNVTRAPRTVQ